MPVKILLLSGVVVTCIVDHQRPPVISNVKVVRVDTLQGGALDTMYNADIEAAGTCPVGAMLEPHK